jgi:hypothetical protein
MIVDEKSLNDGYHAESTGGHPSLSSPCTNIRPVSIDDQSEKVKQQQQSENELTFLTAWQQWQVKDTPFSNII